MSNGIVQIDSAAGKIWEISPSTLNVLGLQVPVAGGGYFRLFPYAASKTFLQRLEKQGAKFVMYFHPWEIDPKQPRMDGPWVSQFRHYLNLHKTQDRLCSLLNDFCFNTIQKVLEPIAGAFSDSDTITPHYEESLAMKKRVLLVTIPPDP